MATAAPSAQTLGPEWLAHRYEEGRDAIHFIRVDRETRNAITFLTDDYLPKGLEPQVIGRREALAMIPSPAPIHFVLHSAFCCSTLIAAALDRTGTATTLREPQLLNDVVGWRRRGAPPAQVGELLHNALDLLARPFEAGEAVVVKPSNVLNALAPAVLKLRPQARALLLHAPLRTFLTSVAKKGLDGRAWVRKLFLGYRTDGIVQRLGFDDAAFFGQTDLQIAASGWLAQQAIFADMVRAQGAQVRTLDSETLLGKPEAVLAALAAHFELSLGQAEISEIVGTAFRRSSKTGEAFGKAERDAEYGAAATAHADEIDKVARWGEAVAETAGIPMELGSALV